MRGRVEAHNVVTPITLIAIMQKIGKQSVIGSGGVVRASRGNAVDDRPYLDLQ